MLCTRVVYVSVCIMLLKRTPKVQGMGKVSSTLVDKCKTYPTKTYGYVVFSSTAVDNSLMLTKEQAITFAGFTEVS
jgi:hypothetical protein